MKKKIFFGALFGIIILIAIALWAVPIREPRIWGLTFSARQARTFNLDPDEVLRALVNDLGMKALRLSAYWDDVESTKGSYDFSQLDRELAIAREGGATVLLAMGRKLPRWPECHDPSWLHEQSAEDARSAQLAYVRAVVERYKDESVIGAWQVENEPFLPYGYCPNYDVSLLDEEIAIVRELDATRKIIVTDSGELSLWVRAAKRADIFGTTMYRKVSNRYFGLITYPIPPSFFRVKRAFTEWAVGSRPSIVIELQGEPWDLSPYQYLPIERQFVTMGPEDFADTLAYAERTGFDTFYLWGGEWWYWLKTQGHTGHWDMVRERIRASGN